METTKKVTLRDKIIIGNPEIDNDHRKLLEIYNELVDLIEYKMSRQDFARILTKMTDYSLIHFKKEEKYMEQLSYPNINEHIAFHRDYIYKVAMYNLDLLNENGLNAEDVLKFLKAWWINHIMKIDLLYEKFKNENENENDLNIKY